MATSSMLRQHLCDLFQIVEDLDSVKDKQADTSNDSAEKHGIYVDVNVQLNVQSYCNEKERMSTKTIDTTDLRNNLSATINALGKDDVLFIKSRGKLTGKVIIDDELLEDLLLLQDGDYLKSISRARKEIKSGDVYAFDEVFGDVL